MMNQVLTFSFFQTRTETKRAYSVETYTKCKTQDETLITLIVRKYQYT